MNVRIDRTLNKKKSHNNISTYRPKRYKLSKFETIFCQGIEKGGKYWRKVDYFFMGRRDICLDSQLGENVIIFELQCVSY